MRNRRSTVVAVVLSASAALFLASPARANIIPVLDSITAVAGGYDWTYSASLDGTQDIETAISPGFFTLYDIGPVSVVGTTGLLSSDFTYSQLLTDTPAKQTSPVDSASVLNLRFIDSGTDIAANSSLGTFTIFSRSGTARLTNYDGQAVLVSSDATADDTINGDIGHISAPNPTPLPAALPLFATGLAGLWAWGRKRKGKQPKSTMPATA
jgi:hypothetical protein